MRRHTDGSRTARAGLIVVALGLALPAIAAASPADGSAEAAAGADAAASAGAAKAAEAPKEGGASTGFGSALDLGSSREPIAITANQLDFDYQKNRVTYRGAVRAVQGDLAIDCDTLIVTLDRADDQKQAQLREVIAQGNVVIVQGSRRATGSTAVFSQPKRQIVLIGDPILRDGPNEITGDRIIVFVDEGRSVVESSPKKRVTAVLYPGSTDGGLAAPSAERGGAAAPAGESP